MEKLGNHLAGITIDPTHNAVYKSYFTQLDIVTSKDFPNPTNQSFVLICANPPRYREKYPPPTFSTKLL